MNRAQRLVVVTGIGVLLVAVAFTALPYQRGRCDAAVLEWQRRRVTAAEFRSRGGEIRESPRGRLIGFGPSPTAWYVDSRKVSTGYNPCGQEASERVTKTAITAILAVLGTVAGVIVLREPRAGT